MALFLLSAKYYQAFIKVDDSNEVGGGSHGLLSCNSKFAQSLGLDTYWGIFKVITLYAAFGYWFKSQNSAGCHA